MSGSVKIPEVISLSPIGVVHTTASEDEVKKRVPGLKSTVEIYPAFQDGLDGLDGFTHIFVISYFHKLRPEQIGHLKVKPRGLLRYGIKLEDTPFGWSLLPRFPHATESDRIEPCSSSTTSR